jgi:hypothetical protein
MRGFQPFLISQLLGLGAPAAARNGIWLASAAPPVSEGHARGVGGLLGLSWGNRADYSTAEEQPRCHASGRTKAAALQAWVNHGRNQCLAAESPPLVGALRTVGNDFYSVDSSRLCSNHPQKGFGMTCRATCHPRSRGGTLHSGNQACLQALFECF